MRQGSHVNFVEDMSTHHFKELKPFKFHKNLELLDFESIYGVVEFGLYGNSEKIATNFKNRCSPSQILKSNITKYLILEIGPTFKNALSTYLDSFQIDSEIGFWRIVWQNKTTYYRKFHLTLTI